MFTIVSGFFAELNAARDFMRAKSISEDRPHYLLSQSRMADFTPIDSAAIVNGLLAF